MGTAPKRRDSDMSLGLAECLRALCKSTVRCGELAGMAHDALTPIGMRDHLHNCEVEIRHARDLTQACRTLLEHQVQERMRAP